MSNQISTCLLGGVKLPGAIDVLESLRSEARERRCIGHSSDESGCKDLACLRSRHDPGRNVDRESGDVIASAVDFTDVDTDTHLEFVVFELRADHPRHLDRSRGRRQECENAVPGGLDDLTTTA